MLRTLENPKPTIAIQRYIKNNQKRIGVFEVFKEKTDPAYWNLPNFMRFEKAKQLTTANHNGDEYLQEMVSENYKDCELLIYALTHNAAKQFHMPFVELLGQAQFAFMRAVYRYSDAVDVKFTTWISFCVKRNLTTWCKSQYLNYNTEELDDNMFGTEQHNSFLMDFKDELDEDGKYVVDLMFNTPDDLEAVMKWDSISKRRAYLAAVRDYLKDMGWTSKRVAKAFTDIQTKLFGDNR